ncbi:MAG: CFI-box-CTERM domain-containing protein [Deltaproteobacteria bacterium]
MRAEDVDIVEDLIALNYISRMENKGNDSNNNHIHAAYDLIKELVAIHNLALLARFVRCMKYGEKNGSTTDRWAKDIDQFLAKAWVPKCAELKINLVGLNIKIAIQVAVDEILKYRTDDKLETILNYDNEQLDKACHISYPTPIKSSSGCFIATAAYGSPLEANVLVLREFRDTALSATSFGRWFIRFYYQTSPPIARMIESREFAKKVVRTILKPIVFLVGKRLKSRLTTSIRQEEFFIVLYTAQVKEPDMSRVVEIKFKTCII